MMMCSMAQGMHIKHVLMYKCITHVLMRPFASRPPRPPFPLPPPPLPRPPFERARSVAWAGPDFLEWKLPNSVVSPL